MLKVKVNDRDLGSFRIGVKGLKSLKKPMGQFLAYLEKETKTQFINGVDPEGRLWEDLKPETWARKRSDSILRENSIMINTMYTRASDLNGEIGLTSEIAVYHQFGTRKMAKREILGITDDRLEKGAAIFELYVGDLFE